MLRFLSEQALKDALGPSVVAKRVHRIEPIDEIAKEGREKRAKAPSIEALMGEQIRQAKLPTPIKHCKFHPTRKWEFDYAWPDSKVAVEVEGGIWRKGGGAHSNPSNILRDIEKYNAAQELNWKVYRVTTDEVKKGVALQSVIKWLKKQ